MATLTHTLLTLEEFANLPEDDFRHELDHGELITMPQPLADHGLAAGRTAAALMTYLIGHPVGLVVFEMGFQLAPDVVRGPDLAFLTNASLARVQRGRWFPGAPDVAAEIVSPSNEADDLRRKVDEYLDAGAHSVWVLYPSRRGVDVFRQHSLETLRESDQLSEPDLLPGLSIPVAELFG